jgi:hypothetical protein
MTPPVNTVNATQAEFDASEAIHFDSVPGPGGGAQYSFDDGIPKPPIKNSSVPDAPPPKRTMKGKEVSIKYAYTYIYI